MPAPVTGNTVVFKPASDTPHCATLLVELMAEAGFPAGVVNLVTGSGGEVGDAIVDSADVPVISFTGHSSTGKSIAERAARRLKRVSLELGGKNAVVVLRRRPRPRDRRDPVVGLRHDGPALHGLLAGHRRGNGRRTTAREARVAGEAAQARIGPRRDGRRRAADQSRRRREGGWLHRRRPGGGRACHGRRRRSRATSGTGTSSSRRSSRASSRWTGSPRRRSSDRCCRSSPSPAIRRPSPR